VGVNVVSEGVNARAEDAKLKSGDVEGNESSQRG
jgi:hypothetical protein